MSTIDTIVSLQMNSIHLLKYTQSGSHLIACGVRQDSPVVIYKTGSRYTQIYSINCLHPTVEIGILSGLTSITTN